MYLWKHLIILYNSNLYWISFFIGNIHIFLQNIVSFDTLFLIISPGAWEKRKPRPLSWILFLSSLKASFSRLLFQAPGYLFWRQLGSVEGLNSSQLAPFYLTPTNEHTSSLRANAYLLPNLRSYVRPRPWLSLFCSSPRLGPASGCHRTQPWAHPLIATQWLAHLSRNKAC